MYGTVWLRNRISRRIGGAPGVCVHTHGAHTPSETVSCSFKGAVQHRHHRTLSPSSSHTSSSPLHRIHAHTHTHGVCRVFCPCGCGATRHLLHHRRPGASGRGRGRGQGAPHHHPHHQRHDCGYRLRRFWQVCGHVYVCVCMCFGCVHVCMCACVCVCLRRGGPSLCQCPPLMGYIVTHIVPESSAHEHPPPPPAGVRRDYPRRRRRRLGA